MNSCVLNDWIDPVVSFLLLFVSLGFVLLTTWKKSNTLRTYILIPYCDSRWMPWLEAEHDLTICTGRWVKKGEIFPPELLILDW